MSTMPVDVMAVLRAADTTLMTDGEYREYNAACDAIAELIAADEEYDAAITAQYKAKSTKAWRAASERAEAALDRRAAALARVKGEA